MTRTLLVIDIQNEYFPGGALPLAEAEETEARIVDAIRAARAVGDRVVLVQHVSDRPGAFAEGGAGTAIRPAILDAAPDAPVVTKRFADAFQETDLARQLEGTSELLVCGMMTQNCVVFTSLSRDADGYAIRVLGNLCAAPTEVVHAVALRALASKTEVIDSSLAWADA